METTTSWWKLWTIMHIKWWMMVVGWGWRGFAHNKIMKPCYETSDKILALTMKYFGETKLKSARPFGDFHYFLQFTEFFMSCH